MILTLSLAAGCAIDDRTGKALADALATGPVRDYASTQADTVAETSLVLQHQAAPDDGGQPDISAARQSWLKARAAYDRGLAVFLVVAPDLDFQLDGHQDDPFATTGLRQVERALFAMPLAPSAELSRLAHTLTESARALHVAVPDTGRVLAAAGLIGSMSAVAAQMANKFDGIISPYAGAALPSVQNNLVGLMAMYAALSPLVQGADPALDQRIGDRMKRLLGQVRALPSIEAVTDKTMFLRECADLALDIRQIGRALQLSVTPINLS